MGNGGSARRDLEAAIDRYLQSWGLREFHDETSYYDWQRANLPTQSLHTLQSLVEQRQGGENIEADIAFYDLLAIPPFLSILYSQRFDYFRQIGLLLSPRISLAEQVLDFGCGVGILTCYFAQQHPGIQFMGMDRSVQSIEVAQGEAQKRQLSNVQFQVSRDDDASAFFDCILSTQVLLQTEREPGLPSHNWRTFQRTHDLTLQERLEHQTGLSERLERLVRMLSPRGRLICFEKTWNLGRRIFFQRALNKQSFSPIFDPVPCSYHELGEPRIDGPIYELSRISVEEKSVWNEDPFYGGGESLYRCTGITAERMGKELRVGQFHKEVSGQNSPIGPWSVQFGVWEEVLAWGLCETEAGFRGLLVASEGEKEVIFSLLRDVKSLTDSDFANLLQNCWGNISDASQSEPCPGYENHLYSAQNIYRALPSKVIQEESTFTDRDGKEMHIEIGAAKALRYLYWANTFDQRQLLLTDEQGAELIREYYQESLEEASDA